MCAATDPSSYPFRTISLCAYTVLLVSGRAGQTPPPAAAEPQCLTPPARRTTLLYAPPPRRGPALSRPAARRATPQKQSRLTAEPPKIGASHRPLATRRRNRPLARHLAAVEAKRAAQSRDLLRTPGEPTLRCPASTAVPHVTRLFLTDAGSGPKPLPALRLVGNDRLSSLLKRPDEYSFYHFPRPGRDIRTRLALSSSSSQRALQYCHITPSHSAKALRVSQVTLVSVSYSSNRVVYRR